MIQMGLAENQVSVFKFPPKKPRTKRKKETRTNVIIGSSASVANVKLLFLQLSFDLLETWLAQNPDAAGLRKDGESIFRQLALFQDYHGLPSFKNVRIHYLPISDTIFRNT